MPTTGTESGVGACGKPQARLPVTGKRGAGCPSDSPKSPSAPGGGTTATTAKRTVAPRRPTAAQAAELNGATFEDDGIKWKVLKVEWPEEYGSILVYYYDVSAVAAASKSEAELDDDDDDVEASSIKEVLEWIKKSS